MSGREVRRRVRAWQTTLRTSADSSEARRKREVKNASMLAENEGGLVMMNELSDEMDCDLYFAFEWSVAVMSLGIRKSSRRWPPISMSSWVGRSSQILYSDEKAPWRFVVL